MCSGVQTGRGANLQRTAFSYTYPFTFTYAIRCLYRVHRCLTDVAMPVMGLLEVMTPPPYADTRQAFAASHSLS